jgi:protein SCO1/2|tara:strand:+ start:544 stop:1164 length:621 start_codon:yes stop_codon:yes gene_type:complete
MKRKIIYLFIIITAIYFSAQLIENNSKRIVQNSDSRSSHSVESDATPEIGGNFNLINQFNKQVSMSDFSGDYLLIYFGYTFCPDVCPLSVNEMLLTKKRLEKVNKKITPIFITIDPERDDLKNIKAFAEKFDNEIICLTGNKKEISETTKKFRIYVKRSEEIDDNEQYLIDHASIFYIFNKKGKFLKHFPHGSSAEELYQYLNKKI